MYLCFISSENMLFSFNYFYLNLSKVSMLASSYLRFSEYVCLYVCTYILTYRTSYVRTRKHVYAEANHVCNYPHLKRQADLTTHWL